MLRRIFSILFAVVVCVSSQLIFASDSQSYEDAYRTLTNKFHKLAVEKGHEQVPSVERVFDCPVCEQERQSVCNEPVRYIGNSSSGPSFLFPDNEALVEQGLREAREFLSQSAWLPEESRGAIFEEEAVRKSSIDALSKYIRVTSYLDEWLQYDHGENSRRREEIDELLTRFGVGQESAYAWPERLLFYRRLNDMRGRFFSYYSLQVEASNYSKFFPRRSGIFRSNSLMNVYKLNSITNVFDSNQLTVSEEMELEKDYDGSKSCFFVFRPERFNELVELIDHYRAIVSFCYLDRAVTNRVGRSSLQSVQIGVNQGRIDTPSEERDYLDQNYSSIMRDIELWQKELESLQQAVHNRCIQEHDTPNGYYQRGMHAFFHGDYRQATFDILNFIERKGSAPSHVFCTLGESQNQLELYHDAIASLSTAIESKPGQKDAYFNRAISYFELGNYEKSLEDFLFSGSQITPLKASQTNYLNFATGFISGATRGCKVGVVEFAPSMVHSVSTIGKGVWAFACSPIEVGTELVSSCQDFISYVKENGGAEVLKIAVPEARGLIENWESLSDQERGEQFGYIIGKYGVDVLFPAGGLKAVKRFRKLKKANAALALNSIKNSTQKAKVISTASGIHVEVQAKKVTSLVAKSAQIKKKTPNISTFQVLTLDESLSLYTKNNYRKKLIEFTKMNPGAAMEAHHVFPQKYALRFAEMEINIHEPRFLAWWEKSSHRKNAKMYNSRWDEFFDRPSHTRQEAADLAKSLMQEKKNTN